MSSESYKLRVLNEVVDTDIHQLPVVFTGDWCSILTYASNQGYTWKIDKSLLFKGYYMDKTGNCYYITL